MALVDSVAKAQERHDPEHGGLEVVADGNRTWFLPRPCAGGEVGDEILDGLPLQRREVLKP
jgi:hypothetical protein